MRLPFRVTSLGARLVLALFLAIAGAIAIVYLAVVPRLESRLVNAKLVELRRASPAVADQVVRHERLGDFSDLADVLAATLNARVVVFERAGPAGLLDIGDSSPRPSDVLNDPVARVAAARNVVASGRVERGEAEYAEVARPAGSRVVLLSAPLHDALSASRLVRRSLIAAGLISLAITVLAGALAAWTLTRRVRRLELAAEKLSAGDFTSPISDTGEDEVGQLARAFDRMRLRLAQLDDVRREFIANASHELRTPLFSLGGFLELLADEDVDERTRREFLAEMRGQVDRLTKLATELLDLSRLDADQLSVAIVELDLAAAARTIVDEFRPLAERERHALRFDGHGAVAALGDEQRVLQVGRSLVENALRHTPPGTPVTVTVRPAGSSAELVVRDAGPGIAPEDRERLFERFYRGSGQHASGSGLGLAIASELAVRMGGSIEVASHPGLTTFVFRLPAAEASVFTGKRERDMVTLSPHEPTAAGPGR